MAGTGIVARTVADRHRVIVNDANPFAALLAHCQGIDATGVDPASIIDSLRDSYIRNYERLSAMIETRLEEEASFLHGELDDAMARRYAAFTSDPPLTVTGGEEPNLPARLVTDRYANVYFGIVQSVEIDSLRAAIEFDVSDHRYRARYVSVRTPPRLHHLRDRSSLRATRSS